MEDDNELVADVKKLLSQMRACISQYTEFRLPETKMRMS